ncbi:Cytochrome P450 [Ophiocordyceps camponoti-floridani]|uniref:Cytochrome P450 n=1 Tax=Ophiocordyceps camponoti-floridani TaxID=2030778 RepID=A0A8H4VGV4_9HYPO|nr:Cytochrome P450 [Ophiocordyceps camponoti-floridani]
MVKYPIIVLNSARAAVDLLVKRGDKYSDRLRLVLYDFMGWNRTMSFMRHEARHRKRRRSITPAFKGVASGLLNRPAERDALPKQFASALIFCLGFGIDVKDKHDHMIHLASGSVHSLPHGGAFSGAPDKSLKLAADWKWAVLKLHDEPFEAYMKLQKKMWSLMHDMLEQ